MNLDKSSLTVVLLGDWNKLYNQPKWTAENVYCQKEIEIGVIGQGADLSITYRCNNIVIAPSQSQMTFTALDIDSSTIGYLVTCVNNFLQKATTPELSAFGFNCEFTETNCSQFADVLDSISDNSKIIENGYEIINTKISRSLNRDGKIINLDSTQNKEKTIMHFNEHHGSPVIEMPVITVELIQNFISDAKSLLLALGYDVEEME